MYLCLVLLCLHASLFVDTLWSPAWKGLTYCLSFVMSYCGVATFHFGILGQVWCLIVSIPDLCLLSYFTLTLVQWSTVRSGEVFGKKANFNFLWESHKI